MAGKDVMANMWVLLNNKHLAVWRACCRVLSKIVTVTATCYSVVKHFLHKLACALTFTTPHHDDLVRLVHRSPGTCCLCERPSRCRVTGPRIFSGALRLC